MNEKGRITDVVIEDVYFFKGDPDKESLAGYVMVWADAGMKDIIAGVEGVEACYKDWVETRYHAYLDKRYHRFVVKSNIMKALTPATTPNPEPAPKMDADLIKSLILQIKYEANSWGFHEAVTLDCKDSDVKAVIKNIANGARERCFAAQAKLEKLLGI